APHRIPRLVAHGQLRVEPGLHPPVRPRPRGLRDPAADAKRQRGLVFAAHRRDGQPTTRPAPGSRGLAYLTEPAKIPRTKARWRARNTPSGTIIVRNAPAVSRCHAPP